MEQVDGLSEAPQSDGNPSLPPLHNETISENISAPVDRPEGMGNKSKKPAAFAKECVLSEELAAFLGKERMTRSEVVSSMWRTIREKALIDPNQKQFAICDDQLLKVIGKKRFKVFGMMKYLKDHIRDPSKL